MQVGVEHLISIGNSDKSWYWKFPEPGYFTHMERVIEFVTFENTCEFWIIMLPVLPLNCATNCGAVPVQTPSRFRLAEEPAPPGRKTLHDPGGSLGANEVVLKTPKA